MAFVEDVSDALISTLAGVLFPTITYRQGDLQVSSAGPQVRLYKGWPLSSILDTDLALGQYGINSISAFAVHVSIFPAATMARNTTRYLPEWVEAAPVVASTFTAVKSGRTITFGGKFLANTVVGVAYGNGFAPPAYARRLVSTDTPTSVATLFKSKYATASLSGSTLTFPDDQFLTTNVVVDGVGLLQTRMQEQYFRITVWSPTPIARTLVSGFVDAALSNVRSLGLADGTSTGRPEYRSIFLDDVPEKSREFRADMQVCVEYPTTVLQSFPRLLFSNETITPANTAQPRNFGVSIIP